ncbi:hypothetical protein OLMES_2369 [Oleiphilus messinensis]|uniref:Uncharacterized protein n=1 Tax=Oleiphilus messinensis TaxID=141451 RepID=A0A1Y0I7F8_9GAMM|nr:hypothetical protein [Oleiphilus messinensis]ARU56432.1 hypothetical protein OLMES_2369 [Oleiphilus messinensis]
MIQCIIVVLVVQFLMGCASHGLPEATRKTSVLVIPLEIANESSGSWINHFQLELVPVAREPVANGLNVPVPTESTDFILVTELAPGAYAIANLVSFLAPEWQIGRGGDRRVWNVNLPFDLYPGEATLFNHRLKIRQRSSGDGRISTQYYFDRLEGTEMNEFANQFESQVQNADSWQVNYQTE